MACGKGGYDWPKEATITLINLYEEHPCLYLPTHGDYHNRAIRNRALQEIATEFNRQKLTSLTSENIKKKIHGVRTQFLAEANKVKKSEVSGASPDEVYEPKLWCFEQLKFLQQGTEVVQQGESNMRESTSSQAESVDNEVECEVIYDGYVQVRDEDMDIVLPTSQIKSRASIKSSGTLTPKSDTRTKRRVKRKVEQDNISDLLTTAVTTLENINVDNNKQARGKYSTFGSFVAEELEDIEDKDIVNDVKQAVLECIFNGKKRQMLRRNENTSD